MGAGGQVRAEVMAIESDRPILQVQSSREFSEKSDGEMILKILKRIVAGRLEVPYLVIVETKRGIENQNPLFQANFRLRNIPL